MYRGTTPTIIIDVTGENFSSASKLWVTFRQEENIVTRSGAEVTVTADGDDSEVSCALNEHETLAFRPGDVYVQIRWKDTSGVVYASPIVKTSMNDILLEGVI